MSKLLSLAPLRALHLPGPGAILALALGLRLFWAFAVPVDLFSDPAAYDTLARNLAATGVYGWAPDQPTAFWAVGATAFYAAGYTLFGTSSATFIGLNIALSLLIVWLTIRVASGWFGARAGRLAGLLVVLWPALIQFVTLPNSELLFTALLLAALATWAMPGGAMRRGGLTGLVLGAATLVRPVALLVPVLLALGPRLRGGPGAAFGPRVAAAGLALVCIALVVAPWSMRNHAVFGEVVLVSTNFGPNLWMGNNPASTGRYQDLPERVAGLSETARAATLQAEAIAHIRSDPAAFAQRFVAKVGYLFSRETTGVTWNGRGLEARYGAGVIAPLKAVSTLYWYAMLGLAFVGVWRLLRAGAGLRLVLFLPVALIGYFAVVHGVIFVSDRFHIPLNPLLAALAAVGVLGVAPARRA